MRLFARLLSLLPGTAFVLEFANGQVEVSAAHTFPRASAADIREVLRFSGVDYCVIRGVWNGRDLTLSMPRSLPPGVQQRLLNVWNAGKHRMGT